MTLDELVGHAEAMALPVVHLGARNTGGDPVGSWSDEGYRGKRPWLRVSLGRHPAPQIRRDTVLSFGIVLGHETGQAAFSPEPLLPLADETLLWATNAVEWPPMRWLVQAAEVQEWIRTTEWWDVLGAKKPTQLREYETVWMRRHPMKTGVAYAQLGGWQIGWGIDDDDFVAERELVLRTYRHSEPWIEVLRVSASDEFEVHSRNT